MPAFDKTLVLDLDRTLIYADEPLGRQHDILVGDPDFPLGVYKRPGLDKFLIYCFSKFEVGVWSQAPKTYMEDITNAIFNRFNLKFKYSQEECDSVAGLPIIKSVAKLEQRLKIPASKIIIIDDNLDHYLGRDDNNVVKALEWLGSEKDDYLDFLPELLDVLSSAPDVRMIIKENHKILHM